MKKVWILGAIAAGLIGYVVTRSEAKAASASSTPSVTVVGSVWDIGKIRSAPATAIVVVVGPDGSMDLAIEQAKAYVSASKAGNVFVVNGEVMANFGAGFYVSDPYLVLGLRNISLKDRQAETAYALGLSDPGELQASLGFASGALKAGFRLEATTMETALHAHSFADMMLEAKHR